MVKKVKVIFMTLVFCTLNFTAYSQSITLKNSNVTVKQAIEIIKEKTGYSFVFEAGDVDTKKIISLNVSNQRIEDLIQQVIAGQSLKFEIKSKNIILSKKIISENKNQSKKITGLVTDEKGDPIIGASILIKGESKGTITDVSGKFTIDSQSDATLKVSYIGYISQDVAINNQSQITVKLLEDSKTLDEVVVVGYGTMKKRDMIGSVTTIKESDIKTVASTSFANSLQGKAAGVSITESSGVPGAPISVKIRGINSISAGTDPLWIIDGMPVISGSLGRSSNTVGQDVMSTINSNDIQSVEILKDAAATAIYGSRGSNGVIIVTTKSGKSGKGKGNISVDYSTGISNLTKSPESMCLANTKEWFEIMDRAKAANGRTIWTPAETMVSTNFVTPISREDALLVNTNWFDELLRQGSYNDANLSYSQGLEKGNVFASFNIRNDKSVNKGNDFSRMTALINVNLEPVKNFMVGTKLNLMYTNNDRTKASGQVNTGLGSGFGAASQNLMPWYKVYDENDPSGYWNPYANAAVSLNRDLKMDNKKTYRAIGGIFAEYKLPWVEGLSIRAEGSADLIQDNATDWISGITLATGATTVYEGAITRTSFNYNTYLKYNNTLNEIHNFVAVAGTESQATSMYNREMSGSSPVGYNQELGSTSPALMSSMVGYMNGERYLRSYFGRLNYKLMDKYLIGVSLRRDGSSAFSSKVRWGNFAALSGGWIISDENFFKPLSSTVNLFKLRGSFGQTGNEGIPNDQNLTILNNSANLRYVGKTIIPAGTSISIGNELITWEKTDSYDLGIDFGLFNNRISGSVAYYMKNVSDMLLQVATPPSAAIGSVYDNVGDMNNWGWEFSLNTVNIDKGGFKWETSFNFSTNMNKILRLTTAMESQKGNVLYKGGRLGLYSMPKSAGIDPERGVRMIREIDRDVYNATGEVIETGRKIPATHTNLGLHSQVLKDKSSIPTYYGGIQNTFSYKGFDLGVQINFSGGNYIYNQSQFQWAGPLQGGYVLKADLLTDSWTTPGQTNAKYPLLYTEGQSPATTKWDANAIDPNTGLKGWWKYATLADAVGKTDNETYERQSFRRVSEFLEKGDYIRLKNLTIGYTLPSGISKSLQVEKLRLSLTGSNLFTITEYTGFDPETGNNAIDNVPSLRTYSASVSITF